MEQKGKCNHLNWCDNCCGEIDDIKDTHDKLIGLCIDYINNTNDRLKKIVDVIEMKALNDKIAWAKKKEELIKKYKAEEETKRIENKYIVNINE